MPANKRKRALSKYAPPACIMLLPIFRMSIFGVSVLLVRYGPAPITPSRLEIRHGLLAAHRKTAIVAARWDALDDGPEPRLIGRRLWMAHDAADHLALIEHVVVVVEPLSVATAFVGAD